MKRIQKTYNDEDSDSQLFELSTEETVLYKKLQETLLTLCSSSTFDEAIFRLDGSDWEVIADFCSSKKFENAISDRYEPDSSVMGPSISDINSGFYTLCKNNFWETFQEPYPDIFFYCMRKPDNGLPTVTDIILPNADLQHISYKSIPAIEFTEFPGRAELLGDFSNMILPDRDYKGSIIVFVVSLFDLDKQKRDSNGRLKLELDIVLQEVAKVKAATKRLPIVVYFTKGEDTKKKWTYFHKKGILRERLRAIGVNTANLNQGIFHESAEPQQYMRVVFSEMKKLIVIKLQENVGFKKANFSQIDRVNSLKFDESDRMIFYRKLKEAADKGLAQRKAEKRKKRKSFKTTKQK